MQTDASRKNMSVDRDASRSSFNATQTFIAQINNESRDFLRTHHNSKEELDNK